MGAAALPVSGIRQGEIETEERGERRRREKRRGEREIDQRGVRRGARGGGRREERGSSSKHGGLALCCRSDHRASFIRLREEERERALHSSTPLRLGDGDREGEEGGNSAPLTHTHIMLCELNQGSPPKDLLSC